MFYFLKFIFYIKENSELFLLKKNKIKKRSFVLRMSFYKRRDFQMFLLNTEATKSTLNPEDVTCR